ADSARHGFPRDAYLDDRYIYPSGSCGVGLRALLFSARARTDDYLFHRDRGTRALARVCNWICAAIHLRAGAAAPRRFNIFVLPAISAPVRRPKHSVLRRLADARCVLRALLFARVRFFTE